MSAKGRPERELRPPGDSAAREPDGPPKARAHEREARDPSVRPQAWGGRPTLSRRDLELGRMREVYVEALAEGYALTDEELSASLTATLAKRPKDAGWWVFGYGSLLWNPIFPFAESRRARVHGMHRRFCLWSLASRGTPKAPGLVLGLDRGGSCQGVIYRLHGGCALDELHLLWRREMVTGSYSPRWLEVESDGKRITALGFVVRRDHSQYAGHLSIDMQADVIAHACGAFGSSADYLEHTRTALTGFGITDRYLDRLAACVAAKGCVASAARQSETAR